MDQLILGCVYKKKRWSGDNHMDDGGLIDENKTDEVMLSAAKEIENLREELAYYKKKGLNLSLLLTEADSKTRNLSH